MKVHCKTETMEGESRVAMTPSNARALSAAGDEPGIEESAGEKSGFSDWDYRDNGARILTREQVWGEAEILLTVKGPTVEEIRHSRGDFIISGFYHVAANKPLLYALLEKGITAIDYGTIARDDTGTHILGKMSDIAGAIAYSDGKDLVWEYRGIELGPKAKALVFGIGRAGIAAAIPILETGTKLYILDQYQSPIDRFLERISGTVPSSQIECRTYDSDSTRDQQFLAEILSHIDLAIGATHNRGELQKKLVPEWMIQGMEPGSVLIDIAIDQGGCFATSSPTTIDSPIFIKYGVVHYCVQNMPGTRPWESTPALCNESFPYISRVANSGLVRAIQGNSPEAKALREGIITYKGKITHKGVADSIHEQYTPLGELLEIM